MKDQTDVSIIDNVQSVAQELYAKNGAVTASALVDAARPKDSPAHSAFEWNNAKAGEEYRLIQSRRYLRIVVVKDAESDQAPQRLIHIPASSSEDNREGVYKTATALVKNISEFERALDEATHRLRAARNSVEQLRAIVEKTELPDRAAMVVQVSRALDLMENAINNMH